MRILTFQAKRFWWKTFSKTLDEVAHDDVEDEMRDAVVAFLHIEAKDDGEDRTSVFRKTLKHIKWLANKRELRSVVLHSFTHLGAENAAPEFSKALLDELDERLTATGYDVKQTPFGHFCEWDLSVHGESLAKVWKEV